MAIKIKFYLSLILLVFLTSHVFSQSKQIVECNDTIELYQNGKIYRKYKLCPEGVIDTLFVYEKNGTVSMIYNFGVRYSTQPITRISYYNFPLVIKEFSQYYLNQDNMPVNVGTWKTYWKNGVLKDSVIYIEGGQTYKATFNKKGELLKK